MKLNWSFQWGGVYIFLELHNAISNFGSAYADRGFLNNLKSVSNLNALGLGRSKF